MNQRKIVCYLSVFASIAKLPDDDANLMELAVKARSDAYAPYSGFKVGAAVLLLNGETVIGNNQENASYPSGLCAERVAVFQAGARYPGTPVKAIAISASSGSFELKSPAAPCGNCRQAILEYEQHYNSPIKILMMGVSGEVFACQSIADLLPLSFGKSYL